MNTTNDVNFVGPVIVSLTNITGEDILVPNTWSNVTVLLTATNFLESVELAGQNFHWHGYFSIRGITVTQVSPYS